MVAVPPRKADSGAIEVVVRVRPTRRELHETEPPAWRLHRNSIQEIAAVDNTFTFDTIYGPQSTTRELYERSIRENIIRQVSQGFNGTVFAYGQTGSGKTYTMFGDGRVEGLASICIKDLFAHIQAHNAAKQQSSVEVFVSVLEIYNEQLRDLTTNVASPPPLSIRENAHGVYVHNARRCRVTSAAECVSEVYTHAASRITARTAMNDQSSRSHCVIVLSVERAEVCEEDEDEEEENAYDETSLSTVSDKGRAARLARGRRTTRIVSALTLIDLAGSERVAKTGAVGVRMAEGGLINKSLSALTLVINRLSDGGGDGGGGGGRAGRPPFIPYRDSRLTHLLKTAIGGNSLTCIVCCIAPSVENVDESRSTLNFALRAKRIRNTIRVNEVMHPKTRIRKLEVELRRVKKLMVAQTLYLWAKQTTVKRLEEQLGASSPAEGRSSVMGQQHMIVAQLQARNATLEEELSRLLKGTETDAHSSTAMAELEAIAHDLDVQNRRLTARLREQSDDLKEAELLLEDVGREGESAQQQCKLLQAQLRQAQAQLLEKTRGDAHREELTRLNIKHQELQLAHTRLQEQSQRKEKSLAKQVEILQRRLEDAEDERSEMDDRNKVLHSYVSRFLSLASPTLTLHGQVPGGRGDASAATALLDSQVTKAVHMLTTTAPSASSSNGSQGAADVARLHAEVQKLQRMLAEKDAQRDVIIDTKLRRMQDLALQLHASNRTLHEEMQRCYAENEQLYQMAEDHPKLAEQLSVAGLFPRSLLAATDKARFAKPAERPMGHN